MDELRAAARALAAETQRMERQVESCQDPPSTLISTWPTPPSAQAQPQISVASEALMAASGAGVLQLRSVARRPASQARRHFSRRSAATPS